MTVPRAPSESRQQTDRSADGKHPSPAPDGTDSRADQSRPEAIQAFQHRADDGLDDAHFRYLARQLSRHTLLYTEMVTTGALIHGDTERFLRHNPEEYPLALGSGAATPGNWPIVPG